MLNRNRKGAVPLLSNAIVFWTMASGAPGNEGRIGNKREYRDAEQEADSLFGARWWAHQL